MKLHQVKYCIIGAGVSGLALAGELPPDSYIIIEKKNEVGGYCRTIQQDGFVWDYAGHFFHFNNPAIKERFSGLLESPEVVVQKKKTKIFYKGKYIDYPFQFHIHQLEKEEFIECLCDLFRATDYGRPESFKQMLYSKFGKAIAEKFLIPYNEKLYACDLNKLDIDAMGRFFPKADPVDIVKSFCGEKISTYNDQFYYSAEGAISFVRVLLKDVAPSQILLNQTAVSVDTLGKKLYTNDAVISYKYLINTTPLDSFLHLAKISNKCNFSANKVLVYNMGFDSASESGGYHWVYFPESEYIFYRVGFYNNILNTQKTSLYVEIGQKPEEIVHKDTILKRVLQDLHAVGILTSQKLVSYTALEMLPAYVHISKETQDEKVSLMEQLAKYSIYSIGRYGSWTYCSLEDCISQASELGKMLSAK